MSKFRLKTKITLGVLFLYIMLLVVSILGYYYLNRLNEKAKFILKDNYESLEYAKNMLVALEDLPQHRAAAMEMFSANLRKQQANVTERGEMAATAEVGRIFELLRKDSTADISDIKKSIYTIMDLNMAAIVGKNELVKKTADNALLYIAIISGVCFLLGFTFVYNFPGYIANPIHELTEGIKGIANKQYGKRLYFKSGDEFGELATAFNVMAQRLDEYEHSNLARIMFEKQRAEAVISSLKDATIGFDNNNIILFANAQALQLLSMPEKDVIGQAAEAASKRNDLLRYLINTSENAPLKIVVDGKECFFTRETIDIQHEEKRIGYVVILRNITTFKEQDIAKTHFIATISHELKTPLAASDFSIKLLEDERTGALSTEQRELVDSLKQDNQRMIKIVSELLDLSQVESGNIQLQPQPVTALSIVQYAMDTVRQQAAQREIAIHTAVPDSLPRVLADVEKTAWVLVNLLTNAIRYSEHGAVIDLAVSPTGIEMVSFVVQDYGKGIPAAFRDKIFERFFQVPGMKGHQGSGLGLAISKEFIEAQGGVIGVESSEGKGSRFYFTLPEAPDQH
ncbi:HAMP domain-containing protein [Chitinophaga polysaccharea]|uniref:ATP-binding protein n=1 Tax=Chitinophaga TaxID=79328 RepID=UPI0014554D8E|nr:MULTISPECIES: ATP-binding protein [Chitinophaga]NLR59688.1 HAMP domain-containing protein [Chitinophaga polysaccharea]NLU94041.1 HAMP domain-containing protein [Chitinophaga sp. Ak27]